MDERRSKMDERRSKMDEKKEGKKKELRIRDAFARLGEQLEARTGEVRGEGIRGPMLALAAFLLGNCGLPFGTYPLGLALLCASTGGTFFVAAGLAASCFTSPLPWGLTLGVTALTLVMRVLVRVFVDLPARVGDGGERAAHFRGRLFCESLSLRLTCVCVSAFALSLYAVIAGGFRYYDLFGALFSLVAAPVATFLFSGLFEDEYTPLFGAQAGAFMGHVSRVAAVVSLTYSLKDAALAGISLSVPFAFVATLALCRRRGLIPSLIAGALSGLVLSPSYAPVLAVTAVAFYCIFDVSPMLAASVACIAGTVCGVPLWGAGAMNDVFLPLFSGTAVYCTAEKLIRQKTPPVKPPQRGQGIDRARLTEQTENALRLADTMTELSATLDALGKRQKKPTADELRLMSDGCFDGICPECPRRAECWERGYGTMLETVDKLVSALGEGAVDASLLPRGCPHGDELIEALNGGASGLAQSCFCSEKADIFARDYANTATLLRQLCQSSESDMKDDEGAAAAISARMKQLGFEAATVTVTGERRKRVRVSDMTVVPEQGRLRYIGTQLSRACGFALTEPKREGDTLTARRAAAIDVTWGSSFSAREGVCGDVVTVFRDDRQGVVFALLNDGMGAGEQAAFTAELASLFLRKLLPAGVTPETALQMLNHFLRRGQNRGATENSTTVDLLMIDLLLGRATLIKSGAAPTYIKRDGNVFYLDSKTAPVGILAETDARRMDFELQNGDLVVMVSDGVINGENECPWLLSLLTTLPPSAPQSLAQTIITTATQNGCADDLSVIILKADAEVG